MKSQQASVLFARILVAGLLIHGGSSVARANVVLFNNYVQPGYQHDCCGGYGLRGFPVAARFTPDVDARLESVTVSLFYDPTARSVDVKVHEDASGLPGAELESLTVPLPPTGLESTLFIDSVLKPILHAGSPYWLSLHSSLTSEMAWFRSAKPELGTLARFTDFEQFWFIIPDAPMTVFRIEGSPFEGPGPGPGPPPAPEPGTLALVGGGLLVLLRRRGQD